MTFGEVLTLPPFESDLYTALNLDDNEFDSWRNLQRALHESYGGGPAHQLLGYPDAVQFDMTNELPDIAGEWILLFQLDSDSAAAIEWGDGGRLYFWIPTLDLAEHRFDRVRLLEQCH